MAQISRCGGPAATGASETPRFAHPVERALSGVLDELGVRWRYEPHTFVLGRHPSGSVSAAFTPDFYLPDLDLYLECSVARTGLLRRKRRKIEATQRRYGVVVHLVRRSDFETLVRRWSLRGVASALERPGPRR